MSEHQLSIAITVLGLSDKVSDPKVIKAAESVILGALKAESVVVVQQKTKKKKIKQEPQGEKDGEV